MSVYSSYNWARYLHQIRHQRTTVKVRVGTGVQAMKMSLYSSCDWGSYLLQIRHLGELPRFTTRLGGWVQECKEEVEVFTTQCAQSC